MRLLAALMEIPQIFADRNQYDRGEDEHEVRFPGRFSRDSLNA
jgi:hypothetical protein